ncbi:MAG: peptidylprolyl isomerase [Bacillota bacterium]|nr:peptidylprolyl isomerase [Bacillota bacterium]
MNPKIEMKLKDKGTLVIELYPEIAPETVANFVELVDRGFYNGLIFHRVIPGFMIQGGDPEGTGMGGSDKTIKGEFRLNGFDNQLKHTRGVISMARSQNPNSASSQFFIMHKDSPHLDGSYAAFGKVLEGMEFVDQIANADRDGRDKPYTDQIIESAVVVAR